MYLHRFGSSDAGSVIDCQTIFKNISKIVTENASVNTKNNSSQLTSMPQTIKSPFFKANTNLYHSTDRDSLKILAR